MLPYLSSIFLAILSISVWAKSAESFQYAIPSATDDGWSVGHLRESNINDALLVQMVNDIQAEKFTGISSILLARNSKLVFEAYLGDFKRDDIHSTRSASKSITSALVGIAIDKGFIASENVPLLDYFPEYHGNINNWDERKNTITLAHVMSMTSGIKGNEDAMYPTNDWIKFYLDQPLVNQPGNHFSYATSGVVTLGNVITRASGKRIPEFTNTFLFGPLGIKKYKWPITNSKGSQGLAMTGGGLHLTPRDMLKFGQLYLNKGKWQGTTIISENWIEKSTSKQSTSDLYGEDYGYLWRMIDRQFGGKRLRSIEAWGNGGQFIMVFPTLALVAVFTGENYGKFPQTEQPFLLLDDYILPAIN